jgi:hypothetical protein
MLKCKVKVYGFNVQYTDIERQSICSNNLCLLQWLIFTDVLFLLFCKTICKPHFYHFIFTDKCSLYLPSSFEYKPHPSKTWWNRWKWLNVLYKQPNLCISRTSNFLPPNSGKKCGLFSNNDGNIQQSSDSSFTFTFQVPLVLSPGAKILPINKQYSLDQH